MDALKPLGGAGSAAAAPTSTPTSSSAATSTGPATTSNTTTTPSTATAAAANTTSSSFSSSSSPPPNKLKYDTAKRRQSSTNNPIATENLNTLPTEAATASAAQTVSATQILRPINQHAQPQPRQRSRPRPALHQEPADATDSSEFGLGAGSPADSLLNSPPQTRHDGLPDEHEHEHGHDGEHDGAPAAKRRRTGPGARAVANLTEEQRNKKRANDREAQRAIRERARRKVESLEQEIAELKSQKPYQELQATIRRKDAVDAENVEIKRVLAAVVAMIEPILNRPSSDVIATVEPPVYPSPGPSHPVQPAAPAPPSLNKASTPNSVASPASAATHGYYVGSDGPSPRHSLPPQTQVQTAAQAKLLTQQRSDMAHGLEMGAEKLGLDFLLDSAKHVTRAQSGTDGAQDSPQDRHAPMKHDWTSSVLPGQGQGHGHGHGHSPHSSSVHVHGHGQYNSSQAAPFGVPPLRNGRGPAERSGYGDNAAATVSIKNCAPTCPLDSLLLDFLHERRQRAAEGLSPAEIIGPRYPSVSSLLNPANSRFSHPLSKVFTDILATFPDLSQLPERVAVLYVMFLIMRWMVHPTAESHARLPDWATPLPVQLARAHPAWIDHLPFPAMRERLIADYAPGEFAFENFFIPFTTTLDLNWPYADTDTLLQSPDGDELMINPVFERHLRRLENWTLGDAFDRAFPSLRGTYNLKSGGDGAVAGGQRRRDDG